MMQTTEDWRRANGSDGLYGPRYRRVLAQGEVCSGAIVIFQTQKQNVAQMLLAEDRHMVKTLLSDRADQPFAVSILLR